MGPMSSTSRRLAAGPVNLVPPRLPAGGGDRSRRDSLAIHARALWVLMTSTTECPRSAYVQWMDVSRQPSYGPSGYLSGPADAVGATITR